WSATSAGTASASEPARSISETALSSAGPFRAVTTTFAPRSPAPRAIARPTPLDAPVTRTTCSLSGFFRTARSYPQRDALRLVYAGDWHRRAHRDPDRSPPPVW